MHRRQRKADIGLIWVLWRPQWLACAWLLFAVRAFAVPAAPGNLLGRPANARVTVTWSAVTGATGYNVHRSLTPGGTVRLAARQRLDRWIGAIRFETSLP
jgi:hypothetical protein